MNRSFLTKPLTLLITFGVLLGGLLVADGVTQLVEEHERGLQRELLSAQADAVCARIEGQLEGLHVLVSSVTAYASAQPQAPLAGFNPLLGASLRDNGPVRALVLKRGDEPPLVKSLLALEAPPLPDASLQAAVHHAMKTGQTVLAGPFEMTPSANAVVQFSPVFVDGELWGWLHAVVDVDALLNAAGLRLGGNTLYAMRGVVSDGSAPPLLFGSRELFSRDAVVVPLNLPGGEWQLAVMPADGWASESRLRVIGFATALVLSLFAYVLLAEREREKQLALHDPLTGLPNRLFFDLRIDHAITRAERHGRAFALLYLDLDDFKPVNDRYGHKAGDRVLVETGRRIRKQLRRVDTVARIGGDEYMVILDDMSGPAEAEVVAHKLIDVLSRPINVGVRHVTVGVSIGASFYPISGATPDELIRRADQAMYRAKSQGKNRCCFDEPGSR